MARTAAAGTRERILDAVTPLFYERGVRAVGMSEVVAAAGCGKNLLYSHFPSKDDLVAGYLDRFRDARDEAVEQAVRRAGSDPADQLVAVVAEVADRVREPYFRGCPFRNHLTEVADRDSAPARICRDYLTQWRNWTGLVTGQLDVADPGGLADRIWLVVEGLYASAAHPVDERSGETAVAFVREIIDRAVADHRS